MDAPFESCVVDTAANHGPAFHDTLVAGGSIDKSGGHEETQIDHQGERGLVLKVESERVVIGGGIKLYLIDRAAFHLRKFDEAAVLDFAFDQSCAAHGGLLFHKQD